MPTITAKFPGTCNACNQPFAVGAQVNWTKGEGSRHAGCPTTPGAAPATIVIEPHPTSDTKFVKCIDCGSSCIQGATGQAGILRHARNCDTKATPTAGQLSGKSAPVAPPVVVAAPSVKTYPLYSYRGWVKPQQNDDVSKSVRAGKQAHSDIAGKVVTILTQKNNYQSQEDAEDMGDGRGGWTSVYTVRLATEEEAAPVLAKDAAAGVVKAKQAELAQHRAELTAWLKTEHFSRPKTEHIDAAQTFGRTRYDDTHWLVDVDGAVWHLTYNGRDGDCWDWSNYGSYIADCCTDPIACDKIRALLEVVFGKE